MSCERAGVPQIAPKTAPASDHFEYLRMRSQSRRSVNASNGKRRSRGSAAFRPVGPEVTSKQGGPAERAVLPDPQGTAEVKASMTVSYGRHGKS
jgi:hypothetical protein